MPSLTARELAIHIARIAWEKDGQDLRLVSFPKGVQICDFCILVTGRSDRQVRAIAEHAGIFAKSLGLRRYPVEGESGWFLLDLGNVILHAFSQEKRQLYDLDSLWPRMTIIDHEAEFRRLPKLNIADPAETAEPASHE